MRHAALLLLALATTNSFSATTSEIMASRYMRYIGCMSRTHGQYFHEKYRLDMKLNKWGVSEPSLASLSKQSPAFQKSEAACRRENDLQLEPRPR